MFPIKFFSLFAMKKSRENESEADLVSGEGSRLVVRCSQWKAKKWFETNLENLNKFYEDTHLYFL